MVHLVNAPQPAAETPATLVWAVRLILAEAAALALLTAYLIFQDFTAEPHDLVVALALTVFAALGTVGVAAVGRALGRRSGAARGPAIVVQLMLMVLAYYMLQAGLLWLGVPLLCLALAVGLLVVAPPTTRPLGLG